MATLDRLFRKLMESGSSDLHLRENLPPKYRQHGHLIDIPGEPVTDRAEITQLLRGICDDEDWATYERMGDLDFAYAMGEEARFRANYFRQQTGHGAVFRIIPTKILSLDELGAPEIFKEIAQTTMGMILVTGPTGSGKSTTLAAILDYINTNYARKIVTIEDPIEFVHPKKRSVFMQREVGADTESFATGLLAAGREDIDVVLVGEMRDLETIALAVSAAEMGVLVFGTLHTNSAAKTLDRVVNVFPSDQQVQVRSMLSTSLKAVISQQLLRKADGGGRVAAHEILLTNPAVQSAVRMGQIAKLNQIVQSNRRMGMTTMDDTLGRLHKEGTISAEAAFLKSVDKTRFEGPMKAEKKAAEGGEA